MNNFAKHPADSDSENQNTKEKSWCIRQPLSPTAPYIHRARTKAVVFTIILHIRFRLRDLQFFFFTAELD